MPKKKWNIKTRTYYYPQISETFYKIMNKELKVSSEIKFKIIYDDSTEKKPKKWRHDDACVYWLEKSLKKGSTDSLTTRGVSRSSISYWMLADIYYNNANYKHAFKYSKILEKNIDKDLKYQSLCSLAHMYSEGLGTKKDLSYSIKIWKELIKLEDRESMFELGKCYFFGNGVRKNRVKAINLIKNSTVEFEGMPEFSSNSRLVSTHHDSYSMTSSRYEYDTGKGINTFESWDTGASQAFLGEIYLYNDPLLAISWFKKAVKNYSTYASNRLGFIYDNGLGVKRDHAKAKMYYHKTDWL